MMVSHLSSFVKDSNSGRVPKDFIDHTVVKQNTESQAKDGQEQRQKVDFENFSPLNECFILDGFKFLLSVSNSNSCSPSSVPN